MQSICQGQRISMHIGRSTIIYKLQRLKFIQEDFSKPREKAGPILALIYLKPSYFGVRLI